MIAENPRGTDYFIFCVRAVFLSPSKVFLRLTTNPLISYVLAHLNATGSWSCATRGLGLFERRRRDARVAKGDGL